MNQAEFEQFMKAQDVQENGKEAQDTGKTYLITEAAGAVRVENHVLRYWEEELGLPVRRNVQGHRYYTEGDIRLLRKIKKWKDQGLQLKAIKLVLKGMKLLPAEEERDCAAKESGDESFLSFAATASAEERDCAAKESGDESFLSFAATASAEERDFTTKESGDGRTGKASAQNPIRENLEKTAENPKDTPDAKPGLENAAKLQKVRLLIRLIVRETMEEYRISCRRELQELIAKEMDYQFRTWTEQQTVQPLGGERKRNGR